MKHLGLPISCQKSKPLNVYFEYVKSVNDIKRSLSATRIFIYPNSEGIFLLKSYVCFCLAWLAKATGPCDETARTNRRLERNLVAFNRSNSQACSFSFKYYFNSHQIYIGAQCLQNTTSLNLVGLNFQDCLKWNEDIFPCLFSCKNRWVVKYFSSIIAYTFRTSL